MAKQKRSTRAVNWARRTNLNKEKFLEELKEKRTQELIKDITGRNILYDHHDPDDTNHFDIMYFYELMIEKGFDPTINKEKNNEGHVDEVAVYFDLGGYIAVAFCIYSNLFGLNYLKETFHVGKLIEFPLNTVFTMDQMVEAVLILSKRVPEWLEDQKAIDMIFLKKERIKGLKEAANTAQLKRIMKGKYYDAYWKDGIIKVDVTFPNDSNLVLQYSAHADLRVYDEIEDIIEGIEFLQSAIDRRISIPRNKIRRNHKHFYEEWYTICPLQNNRNFVIESYTYEGLDINYTSEVEFVTSILNPLVTKKHVKIISYKRPDDF